MSSRAISKSALDRMGQEFQKNYLFDSNAPSINELRVRWSLLADIMDQFNPGSGSGYERGIKFHYGLTGGKELVLAFTPLVLIPELGDPDACRVFEGVHYEIYDTSSGKDVREVADWRGTWEGDKDSLGGRYFELTTVTRPGQGHSGLGYGDPRSCIVPWDDELVLLFDQNFNTGEEPADFDLVITHVAENLSSTGLRHMLAFYMAHPSEDRLDDARADGGRPYHYQAADMVNGCPSECHVIRKR